VAEQQLRGCNARNRRVTAEWLKTPEVVVSTDHLYLIDTVGLFGKACGCRTN